MTNTPIIPPTDQWLAVTDNRWAKLVHCTRTKGGRWHAEEVGIIQSGWEEHQNRDTPPSPGKKPEHSAGWAHKKEEETKRFAKEVAAWLEKQGHDRKITHFSVFAPDHFLGPLRANWSARLKPMIADQALDLTHLKVSELVDHPKVALILAKALNP
jgi:protein required for attachment to host cells